MILNRIYNKIVNTFFRNLDSVRWAKRLGVKVGEQTTISPDTNFSSEPYLISIGNHVQITRSVSIYTHGGGNVVRQMIPDFDCFGKVKIEDWRYIGSESLIMPGVTIGEGALVAAGSVVTKAVPPYMVVGGNPARVLCTVDEFIKRNKKYNTHTKGKSEAEKRKILMELTDDIFIKR